MAAAGSPAARCLTVLLTLAVLLGHPGQALGLQRAGVAAVNPPSYEELSSSLVVNQLTIIKMLQDVSNAASGMAEMEELREEAAARDAKLQEIEKVLQDMKTMIENSRQETLKGVAAQQAALRQEMTSEVTSLRHEITSNVTALREEMTAQGRLLEMVHEYTACPDGWLRREESCYLVDDTWRSWDNSLKYCKGLGGDLAKITSAEENQFITAHLSSTLRWGYWIGLNDRETEGRFVWTDGTAPTYTRWWFEGQPDGGEGEDCVIMYRDDGKWDDTSCSTTWSYGAVCERPVHA